MLELILALIEWIKSQKLYSSVRLLLNLVFTFGIANYFCEHYHIDLKGVLQTDDNGLLNWLVTGKFFLPSIILVSTWVVTDKASKLIFGLTKWLVARYFSRKIEKLTATREDVDAALAAIRIYAWKYGKVLLTKNEMQNGYMEFRAEVSNQELKDSYKELQDTSIEMKANFIAIVRLLLAVSIYSSTIPEFSSTWYWLFTCVGVLALLSMLVASIFIDVLPTFATKLDQTIGEYIQGRLPREKAISEGRNGK